MATLTDLYNPRAGGSPAPPGFSITATQGLNENAAPGAAVPISGGSTWFTQNAPQQSAGSGQTYGAGQFPGLGSLGVTDPNDPQQVRAFINNRVQATQGHPATDSDYQYWTDAINKAGGLGTGEYWYNKMTDPSGTGANAGGAGGGFSGGGLSQDPGFGIFQNLAGGMSPQQILQGNPGYQFALQQAQDAIQKSAAAKGTLLTGGTLKDLAGYTAGAASQNYNNIFNQQLGLAGLGSGMFNQAFGRNLSLADLGYGAAQGQNALASSYGQDVANLLNNQGRASAAGSTAQGNIWGQVPGNLASLYQVQRQNTATAQPYGLPGLPGGQQGPF